MKRYKVMEDCSFYSITLGKEPVIQIIIPAGTEIVLEEVETPHDIMCQCTKCCEVKEEKHNHHRHACWLKDCPGLDQPKDKCNHLCTGNCRRVGCNCECGEWLEDQLKEEKERCLGCGYVDRVCTCERDQPLTPKDVGMRKGQAMYGFDKWLFSEDGTFISNLEDEEFDRLYQQFLSEYKK